MVLSIFFFVEEKHPTCSALNTLLEGGQVPVEPPPEPPAKFTPNSSGGYKIGFSPNSVVTLGVLKVSVKSRGG